MIDLVAKVRFFFCGLTEKQATNVLEAFCRWIRKEIDFYQDRHPYPMVSRWHSRMKPQVQDAWKLECECPPEYGKLVEQEILRRVKKRGGKKL